MAKKGRLRRLRDLGCSPLGLLQGLVPARPTSLGFITKLNYVIACDYAGNFYARDFPEGFR